MSSIILPHINVTLMEHYNQKMLVDHSKPFKASVMLLSSALHPFVCVWDGKDTARRAWRGTSGEARVGWNDEQPTLCLEAALG